MWFVYILKCSDKTLYTGITNNLEKRLREHNISKFGAKYTRGRRPVKVVYSKKVKSRGLALTEEARIKKFSREDKLRMINNS